MISIQQILDSPPQDYIYKIIQPHKRTVVVDYVDHRCIFKLVDFIYQTLFIVKVNAILQLDALYVIRIENRKFYQHSGGCVESCMPHDFYQIQFQNKQDCLNHAINTYFNSPPVNTQKIPIQILSIPAPYHRKIHEDYYP